MIVRRATVADLPQYLVGAESFHRASPAHGVIAFDANSFSQFYMSALQNEDVAIWVAEANGVFVGGCGVFASRPYFNDTVITAQELWWWLTPIARGSGAGSQMLKQIGQWAKGKHACALFMIALENDRVERMKKLYVRAGFKPMERLFIKEL